jgi:hypothetical protein
MGLEGSDTSTSSAVGAVTPPFSDEKAPPGQEAELAASTSAGQSDPKAGVEDADWTPQTDPEFEQAIGGNRASFRQYVDTCYYWRTEFNDNGEKSRLRYRGYRDSIYSAFVSAEGRVVDSYFCSSVVAAAALTARRRRILPSFRAEVLNVHIIDNAPRDAETDHASGAAMDLIAECDELVTEVDEHLAGRWRTVCMDKLYGVVTDALAILDRRRDEEPIRITPTPGEPPPVGFSLVEQARRRLDAAREYLKSAAERLALLYYLRGVLSSAAVVLVVAATLALLRDDASLALWASGAAAVGATASVLSRVVKDGLRLDYEAGKVRLVLLGAIRPVLGAFSGLLLYFGIEGGILPIELGAGSSRTALLAVLGFAAGFSERFAEDMLAYVGSHTGVGPSSETVASSRHETVDAIVSADATDQASPRP